MTRRSMITLAGLAVAMMVVEAVIGWSLLPDSVDAVINLVWIEVPLYLAAVLVVLRDRYARSTPPDGAPGRVATRSAVALILVVAAVLRVMLIPVDPESTDSYRYVWDGRVQGAGINPYRYIPADPALAALRDEDIYPNINRKDYAPTIYPPLAQIVFYFTTRISQRIWFMKTVMVAFDAVTILAIMRLMTARAVPPTRILLYAWHPVPIWQFAGDGHVDAVAVACVVLALLAAETRRPFLAGLAMGGATLTKLFPVLIGPALYRRWDWKLPLAGALTLMVCALPYLGAGRKLLGFSSGYSAEEGFNDGSGLYPWLLLRHLVPGLPRGAFAFYWPAAALILIALGTLVLFRRRSSPADIRGAFALATTFIILTSPHYIWYFAWLIPFLCFHLVWAVMWLTCAATFMNILEWPSGFLGGSVTFLPFVGIGAIEIVVRWRSRRRRVEDAIACRGSSPSAP